MFFGLVRLVGREFGARCRAGRPRGIRRDWLAKIAEQVGGEGSAGLGGADLRGREQRLRGGRLHGRGKWRDRGVRDGEEGGLGHGRGQLFGGREQFVTRRLQRLRRGQIHVDAGPLGVASHRTRRGRDRGSLLARHGRCLLKLVRLLDRRRLLLSDTDEWILLSRSGDQGRPCSRTRRVLGDRGRGKYGRSRRVRVGRVEQIQYVPILRWLDRFAVVVGHQVGNVRVDVQEICETVFRCRRRGVHQSWAGRSGCL